MAVALVAVHAVAGMFQAHLWTTIPFFTFLLSLSILAGVAFRHVHKDLVWIGSITTTVVTIGLYLVATLMSSRFPWGTEWIYGHHLKAFPREVASVSTVLCLVDTVRDRQRFRRDYLETSHKGNCAVICCATEDAVPVSGYDAICAWHERGVIAWEQARLGELQVPVVIMDPHGIPHASPGKNIVDVLISRQAMFVPSVDELQSSLMLDAFGSRLVAIKRDQSPWMSILNALANRP